MQIPVPLNDVELSILNNLFESSKECVFQPGYTTDSIIADAVEAGFGQPESEEAVICLIDRDYVSGQGHSRSGLPISLSLTDSGFSLACETYLSDYDELKLKVGHRLLQIADQPSGRISQIAKDLNVRYLIAWHFVDFYKSLGFVELFDGPLGSTFVRRVSPLLKRALECE